MEMNLLTEAFKRLDMLNEEDFNLSVDDDIEDIKHFMDDVQFEDEKTEVEVIDPEAEESEELNDSYEGKVVLDCCVCHSKNFIDKADVVLNEDETLANVDMECPYCYATEGFKILGEIVPFKSEEEVEEEDKVSVEEKTDEVKVEDEVETTDECLKEDKCEECAEDKAAKLEDIKAKLRERRMSKMKNEDFQKVEIETDKEVMKMTSDEDGRTVVTTERKDFTIGPVEDETKEVIETDTVETEEEKTEDEVAASESDDIEINDFDEESFDELGESYLKNVYSNVKSYRTVSVSEDTDALIVEGLITFNSGNKKKTQFVFTPHVSKNNTVKFLGENLQITKGSKAFRLSGTLNNGKFISESMNYNYRANDVKGKSSRVFGIVKPINESKKAVVRNRNFRTK